MKNLYFLAAVAAFVLGSCTMEEALNPPAGPDDEAKAIGFGTFLDRVPQNGIKPLGTTVGIDELREQGFMVQAYKHAQTDWNAWTDGAWTATPNFMENQTVTWDGAGSPGTWTYSLIKYWPGDKVSFFAYLPSTYYTTVTFAPAKAEDVNKNPKLYCSMSNTLSSQVDLIVDAEYNLTGDAGKVMFNFDHVLSRIGFKAKLKNDYAPATVTMSSMSFTYNGLKGSGTYMFNSGTVTGSNKDPGNWNVNGGASRFNTLNLVPSSVMLSSTKSHDISDPTRYLMLIPQANAVKQAYVDVAYTITYPGTTPSTQNNVTRAYLPEIIWEPGKAYTYTLIIAALKEMIFDVSEEIGWGSEVPDDIFHFHP